jgi:hypothetical protein
MKFHIYGIERKTGMKFRFVSPSIGWASCGRVADFLFPEWKCWTYDNLFEAEMDAITNNANCRWITEYVMKGTMENDNIQDEE